MEEHEQMPNLTQQYGDSLFGDETDETKEVRVRSILVGWGWPLSTHAVAVKQHGATIPCLLL